MREEDLQLLLTLDDPWNVQECETFTTRQSGHTAAHGRVQPRPTSGRHDHRAEEIIDHDSYMPTANTTAGKRHHHELC